MFCRLLKCKISSVKFVDLEWEIYITVNVEMPQLAPLQWTNVWWYAWRFISKPWNNSEQQPTKSSTCEFLWIVDIRKLHLPKCMYLAIMVIVAWPGRSSMSLKGKCCFICVMQPFFSTSINMWQSLAYFDHVIAFEALYLEVGLYTWCVAAVNIFAAAHYI